MGPSLIFDKSTLQMLNPDESLWLDSYFIVNITPIFFVESLADLEKEIRKGRAPEDIVGNLAYKTPEMGCVNTFHKDLIFGELTGQGKVEMKGRPVISGGQAKVLGNEMGVIYEEPPEVEAFKRWQKREFLDVERTIAKKWRASIAVDEFGEKHKKIFEEFFPFYGKPQNTQELKEMVDYFMNIPNQEYLLIFAMTLFGVIPEYQMKILKRWNELHKPPLKKFAPYFIFITTIDLFYYIGLTAGIFTNFPHAQTHKIDLTYLYYIPFCNIFTSNDKFHQNIAPLFMREDQVFINGSDLKNDLLNIDNYYSAFPDEVKNRGTMSFGFSPPHDNSYWTTQMWDKFMSSTWREIKPKKFDGTDKVDKEKEKAMTNKIKKFFKEGESVDMSTLDNLEQAHSMGMKRMVSARKGKWTKFPPEVLNSKPILDD